MRVYHAAGILRTHDRVPEEKRGETLKVLIADDDTYQLDLMDYALRREGYTVLAAINGQQALQRYEAENPDILLLDVTMPKLNGFEVCSLFCSLSTISLGVTKITYPRPLAK